MIGLDLGRILRLGPIRAIVRSPHGVVVERELKPPGRLLGQMGLSNEACQSHQIVCPPVEYAPTMRITRNVLSIGALLTRQHYSPPLTAAPRACAPAAPAPTRAPTGAR